jgi:hypothetical protein
MISVVLGNPERTCVGIAPFTDVRQNSKRIPPGASTTLSVPKGSYSLGQNLMRSSTPAFHNLAAAHEEDDEF